MNFVNVVIPIAGLGSRCNKHSSPKPLINIAGVPLVLRVISNVLPKRHRCRVILVCNKNTFDDVTRLFEKSSIDYVIIDDGKTDGPLPACMRAAKYLEPSGQLLLAHGDQIIRDSDFVDNAIEHFKENHADGGLICHLSGDVSGCYVLVSPDGNAKTLHEKNPVSQVAVAGIHWMRSCTKFLELANVVVEGQSIQGEYWISQVYNELIKRGGIASVFMINKFIGLGTSDDISSNTGKI